jgi:hypothetical protein
MARMTRIEESPPRREERQAEFFSDLGVLAVTVRVKFQTQSTANEKRQRMNQENQQRHYEAPAVTASAARSKAPKPDWSRNWRRWAYINSR